MSRLTGLRQRLSALRSARAMVRWGTALAVCLLVWLAYAAGAFLLDWSIHLTVVARGLLLLAFVGLTGWLVVRRLAPAAFTQDSEEDLALWVERQHRIDSDLVAALQFDAAPPGQWGSARLATAVIDYVAEFSPGLNVFEGFRWRPLPQVGSAAVAALLLSLGLMAAFPGHASAFWNRFWLGSAHYPTKTQIASITINGETVPVFHHRPAVITLPQGNSVTVALNWTGQPIETATIRVKGRSTGAWGQWTLTNEGIVEPDRLQTTAASPVESLRLWCSAGDATSDAIDLELVPLPVIELRWTSTPPEYARSATTEPIPAGARQFSVLQGAALDLELECLNKPLSRAALVLGEKRLDLTRGTTTEGGRACWKLPPGTPLAAVQSAQTYTLDVVDVDGLSPQPAWQGQIRLTPDRVPRVAAALLSKRILPTGKPKISFGVVDDYGVRVVRAVVEITRASGETKQDVKQVWLASGPAPETLKETATIDLAPYQLVKGDELRIILEADDERGAAPSQTGKSEPLVLEVTDRNGILAGLLETDQQSAKQLDAIIERELGIGGSKR